MDRQTVSARIRERGKRRGKKNGNGKRPKDVSGGGDENRA
jgi:hypothetical protein